MNKFRKMAAALMMAGILAFGTSFANAGIIIAGAGSGDGKECSDTKDSGLGLRGIIIAGIIIAKTGIIIAGAKDPNETCGIIIAGK